MRLLPTVGSQIAERSLSSVTSAEALVQPIMVVVDLFDTSPRRPLADMDSPLPWASPGF